MSRAQAARTYLRPPGLDWLVERGRLGVPQFEAGERYGWAYRQTAAGPTVAVQQVGSIPGGQGLSVAERYTLAHELLGIYRRRLRGQEKLVAACDLVCGQEMTPREAAGGDREGLKLEAVLGVALDLLAPEEREDKP